MKGLTGFILGAVSGGAVGFVIGVRTSKKAIEDLKDQQVQSEMFYDEEIMKLEKRIHDISKKIDEKHKFVDADGEEVEVVDDDDMEFSEDEEDDYDKLVRDVTNNKSYIVRKPDVHPIDADEAAELEAGHKMSQTTLWIFADGTVTEDDKETLYSDAKRMIGVDIINKLSEAEPNVFEECYVEFPYYVVNDKEGMIFEILKDERTYQEYIRTV